MIRKPARQGTKPAAIAPSALPPSMRDRIPLLLFRTSSMSHALANQMLARMGLDARQAGILTMVTELEPMTQKDLGNALGIDRTTMVALLDDLEENGYVRRQRHPSDRRAFLIQPTIPAAARKPQPCGFLNARNRPVPTAFAGSPG